MGDGVGHLHTLGLIMATFHCHEEYKPDAADEIDFIWSPVTPEIGTTVTFFLYVFINIAMVTGLIPVVGVPLPLISYGGTSVVTLLAGFGILMSIHGHRTFIR